MKKGSTVSQTHANSGYDNCFQIQLKEIYADPANLTKHNHRNKQKPAYVITNIQEPKEHAFSKGPTSGIALRSHQRRCSADFCKSSQIVVVEKTKKEPQPPQRGVSLLRPHTTSHSSSKRYSCPVFGGLSSQTHSSSSSSSSSSSTTPVPTSVITGRDPLGWKLRPKPSSSSHSAHTNRLSLQIPLPVIYPSRGSNPAPSPNTQSPLKLKPFHHSDSSALPSLLTPGPVVTIEDRRSLNLQPVSNSNESDDVFSEGHDEQELKMANQPCKIPPPVPDKTSTARQVAQLIAHSRQRCRICSV